MHVHVIQHAPFESPGSIKSWAIEKDCTLTMTHIYRGEKVPKLSEFDFLIVLGGPQSVRELDKYPYLSDELQFILNTIEANKSVLGICLGAQLIARCLGAEAELSPHKEIGLFPIQLTAEGTTDPLFSSCPKSFKVMHWHGEMAGLPAQSVVLAESEGCPRQAIRFNERVYGLQFHLEMTETLVQGMIEHCSEDLKPGRFIQNKQFLLQADYSALKENMYHILDYMSHFS